MNNSEILGEEAAVRQIVEDDFSATNGMLEDDSVTALRSYALAYKSFIIAKFPNALTVGDSVFRNIGNNPYHRKILLPRATSIPTGGVGMGSYFVYLIDMGMVTTTNNFANAHFYHLCAVIYRSPTMVTASSVGDLASDQGNYVNADGCGYVYVPRNLIPSYQTATNWATIYANKPNVFRALEDYTVDGTTTGDIDESKMFVPVTPIFSLSNMEFNGSSDYVDTNINMFDGTHGKMTIILDENIYQAKDARILSCFNASQNTGFYLGYYGNNHHGVRWAPPPLTDGMSHLGDGWFKSGGRIKIVIVIDGSSCYVNMFIVNKNDNYGLNGNGRWFRTYTRSITEIQTIPETILVGCGLNSSGNRDYFFNGRINELKIYNEIIPDWQIIEELDIRPEDTP